MKKQMIFVLLVSLSVFAEELPHIGYLFPAGGQPGTTFDVTVGGQYLEGAISVYVSGANVSAEVLNYDRELEPKEENRARRMIQKLEPKLEEESNPNVRKQIEAEIARMEEVMTMGKMEKKARRQNPDMYKKKQFNPQLADTLKLRVSIDPDVQPGAYQLRLVATNGLSNHLMFHISELPEVFEAEPNNEISQTDESAPELPLLLNGQVLPGDVDCFRFYAKANQDLVFQVQARSLVPYLADAVPGWFQAVLTLYDAEGKEIAYVDDFRFDPDPVLICRVPKDGEYILEIRDSIYRGRRDFVYRIAMGELPFIDHVFPLGGTINSEVPVHLFGVNLPERIAVVQTGEDSPATKYISTSVGSLQSNKRPFSVDDLPDVLEEEPNNLPFQSQAIAGGVTVNGRIEKEDDVDCFRFEGKTGDQIRIEVLARRLDSPLDARLVLLDPEEHILVVSDDEPDPESGLVTHHADGVLRYELPETGTYTIRLDDLQGKGGPAYAYRLRVSKEAPDFSLRVSPASLTVSEDGSAVVTIHVLRKSGFDGVVDLALVDAPSGINLSRDKIPSGEDKLFLTISANGRRAGEMIPLKIQGQARIRSRTVRRAAVPVEDQMQAFLYRHLVPADELLLRVTEPPPIVAQLDLPASSVLKVRPGETVSIPVKLSGPSGINGNVQLQLQDAPEWVSLKKKNLKPGTKWGSKFSIEIAEDAPAGESASFVVNGKVIVRRAKDDPMFNPVIKKMNRDIYPVTLGAIPIQIVE
jgi:hypothetical protein